MRVILVLFMCANVVYGVQDSSRHIRTYTTYYGDLGKDFINDVCVDKDNNRIIVGTTQSTKSISTKGAFQESSNGLIDGFISKWSITGELIWATYFGGEYDDYIHGVASDNHGNIYVAGRTTSINGESEGKVLYENHTSLVPIFKSIGTFYECF